MLKDLLDSKKCFKLVCGAGNENTKEVEKLVYTYAKAGCNFFDLSANNEIIESALLGYNKACTNKKPYFCISFGIKGDQHTCKASIIADKCKKCEICERECPQNAIKNFSVITKNCIGCLKCYQECAFDAIEIKEIDVLPSEVLKRIDLTNVSCIELHANSLDKIDLLQKWNSISSSYNGILSICIDRSNLGNKQLLDRIKKMTEDRMPYSTIIQADGIPMSGSNDDYKTTLQAVSIAEIVQDANLPVYLLLSGGTNSKTAELAKLCGIKAHGVALGTYARKIVKEYINKDEFFDNSNIQAQAISIAKELINNTLRYLG